jgi:hypothetical protein
MGRLAALFLLASALHAQSVDGILIDSITHAPIPDVIVTLLGPVRYNGTTDAAGAFRIESVERGKYVLNIVKAGYVLPSGRRAVQIDSDAHLAIEMDPLGRIEGRVHYPDGRPAPRAPVWLRAWPAGAVRTATADAGGGFLFEDLAPGQYAVGAAGAAGDPKPEGEIWAVTWFPSATDPASVEPIRVSTGVAAAPDIRLRSVPARHVHGVVRDEAGRPAGGAGVTLRSGSPGEERTAQTREDGGFDFVVPAGDWRLDAVQQAGDVERRGSGRLTVTKHDVENFEILLALPFSVPLVVERDEPEKPGPRFSSVFLFALDGPSVASSPSEALKKVYPGRYSIQPMGGFPGQYVESVKIGETEVYGRPAEIWDGSQPIRVTYRNGAASIRGVVENGEGTAVAIMSADESLSMEGVRTTTAGAGGRFELGNLRPGDYYVAALERAALRPPELRQRGQKIHLERGATAVLSLKIVEVVR